MRRVQVLVAPEAAERVVEAAEACEGVAIANMRGEDGAGEDKAVVFVTLPNAALGPFIEQAAGVADEAEFVFDTAGTIRLRTPLNEVQDKIRNVQIRSPLELLVGSLQSLGGWAGMLTYSILSGLVAAYAVIFNLSFLLVAAMLIAPIGAPAVVAVVGTAMGDSKMIGRGTVRFVVSVLVLAAAAVALGVGYGLEISTPTMEVITSISVWTGLIAVAGGAAGASAQMRSDRDSLVTGTATGFLIAVSLSPPAAVLGLSATIGRWDYAAQMAFTLLLTYFGIIVGGASTLALHGVRPKATGIDRGSNAIRIAAVVGALAGFAGLVAWQSSQAPSYRKADVSYQAIEVTRNAVREMDDVLLVEAAARFTRPDLSTAEEEALYVQLLVDPLGTVADEAAVSTRIRQSVTRRLEQELTGTRPYVDVTLLSTRASP